MNEMSLFTRARYTQQHVCKGTFPQGNDAEGRNLAVALEDAHKAHQLPST
jgi:hypothetical protein